jgi:hypothetical protein
MHKETGTSLFQDRPISQAYSPSLPLVLHLEKDHTTVQAKACTVVPLFFSGSLTPLIKAGKFVRCGAGIRVALSENNPFSHGAVSRR